MKTRHWRRTVCCFLVLALGPVYVRAQGISGTLRGDVTDSSGLVVPGVMVTLTNAGTGEKQMKISSSNGTFNFAGLLVGRYSITAELKGFKKSSRSDIEVKANQVVEVDVRLEVGSPSEVLEVLAGEELIQLDTSQLGGTFTDAILTKVPFRSTLAVVPGEDAVMNLALLEPGVTSQPGGVVGEGGSIGGNRPRNNNFVLDGVDNNRVDITGHSQPVIGEAVADFTLLMNQFSAEYGHSTAGQYIITTKSGSNAIHGGAWYSMNNRNLNALNSTDKAAVIRGDLPEKPRFDYNQLGGQIGGAIIKDKWFYYGAYEYKTLGQAATPSADVLVPTAAGYSALDRLAASPGSGVSSTMVDILRNNLTPALSTSRSLNVTRADTGAAVPVPVGVLSPSAPNFFNQHDYLVNTDFQTSMVNRLSGRYLSSRIRKPDVPAFPLSQFVGDIVQDAWSATVADVYTAPKWTNELRLGYRRFVQAYALPQTLVKPSTLDIFPNFIIDEAGLALGPTPETPQAYTLNTYQVVDQFTWTAGKHIFKAGSEYRWWITPTNALPRSRGEYDYSSLDSFIKDSVPDGANQGLRGVGTGVFAGNQNGVYWFVQDDWKVHPRLTLNLGLRYEYTSNARDTALQKVNAISSVPGVIEFRQPAVSKNNWAPRIGLAWDPAGDGRTSVRAGFAVAYDVVFQNLPLLALPPQFQQELSDANVCLFTNRPAYCTTRVGFIAEGGLPSTPVPPTTIEDARALTQGLMVDQVPPTTLTWSISMQRELARDLVAEIRYIGNHGYHLPVQVRRNGGIVPSTSLFMPTYLSTNDIPATLPATVPNLAAFLAARRQALSQYGFASGVTAHDPVGNSNYHGLSLSLEKRMSRGLLIKSAYTWSKTIDDSTNELFTSVVNPRRPQDQFSMINERSLSSLDRPHKFSGVLLWELPRVKSGSGLVKALLNGWEMSPNFMVESGQPVTPLSFADANGNLDTAGDRTIINPAGRPRTGTDVSFVCRNSLTGATFVGASAVSCDGNANVVGYVANDPTAKHIRAQAGTLANAGRNTERSAGINNWNLVFVKRASITETAAVEFQMQMINAFNHPQPILGNGSVFGADNLEVVNARDLGQSLVDPRSPDFLHPESIYSGGNRSIMFGLKFIF
jgi:hypothetical protein